MNIQERDLAHIWHPCSQMKDYETFAPLPIKAASGCYLTLNDGSKLIDAFSSWWCKNLGHGHPKLRDALLAQAEQYEHIALANTCQENLVLLSEKIIAGFDGLDKILYAGDGSSAVEAAMKMSLHAQQLRGKPQRNKFMALENDYHGETCLALAASDVGMYRSPYEAFLPDIEFIKHLPYVNGKHDPLWHDCSEFWPTIEKQLNQQADQLAAIIVEPLLQGACGMKVYSMDFLRRLHNWCRSNDVYFIADEILTGFGRTGKPFAINHADITPDFVCLSKGLTAGWLPMSAVLCSDETYDLFYDDYESGKSFLHSHTYTGNALAAAVALANLNVIEDENIYQHVTEMSDYLFQQFQTVADKTQRLINLRHLGFMVSAELNTTHTRGGHAVSQEAIKLGALCRPLGNTLYWLPPLVMTKEIIDELRDITIQAILQTDL